MIQSKSRRPSKSLLGPHDLLLSLIPLWPHLLVLLPLLTLLATAVSCHSPNVSEGSSAPALAQGAHFSRCERGPLCHVLKTHLHSVLPDSLTLSVYHFTFFSVALITFYIYYIYIIMIFMFCLKKGSNFDNLLSADVARHLEISLE